MRVLLTDGTVGNFYQDDEEFDDSTIVGKEVLVELQDEDGRTFRTVGIVQEIL